MDRSKKRISTSKRWIRSGKRLIRSQNHNGENEHCKYRRALQTSPKFVNNLNSNSENQTISLLDLPDECILMILNKLKLEPHELCQIMKVCKRFYELSFNPRLWQIADFGVLKFLNYNTKKSAISVDSPKRYITPLERREILSNFLIKRKAILVDLRLHFDLFKESEMVNSLIDQCCSRELKYIEIKCIFVDFQIFLPDEDICFGKILTKLAVQCPLLSFFKSHVYGSCATANIIGAMCNTHHLDLTFRDSIQREEGCNAIEILLSNLKKLKKFKLRVRQGLDAGQPGYVLKSDSLQHFDYSWSKGFHVQDIHLPRLHTYLAVDTLQMYQGISCPCLFELIEKGCPRLEKLNFKKSKVPGLMNFHLSDIDKYNMHICRCDSH